MPRINEATNTDLKVIEGYSISAGSGGYIALSAGVCPKLPRPLRERVGVRGGNCKGRRHFKEGGERRNTEKINPFFLLDV
jgi:hypothetical protein